MSKVLGVQTTDLAPLSDAPTLHELRWHAGLSAGELAKVIGVSTTWISAQLRGEDRLSHIEAWCKALSVDEQTLLEAWATTRRLKMPD